MHADHAVTCNPKCINFEGHFSCEYSVVCVYHERTSRGHTRAGQNPLLGLKWG